MGDLVSWIQLFVQAILIAGTIGLYIARLDMRIGLLIQKQAATEDKVSTIEKRVEGLNTVMIDIAKQDARLNYAEARLLELANQLRSITRSAAE